MPGIYFISIQFISKATFLFFIIIILLFIFIVDALPDARQVGSLSLQICRGAIQPAL